MTKKQNQTWKVVVTTVSAMACITVLEVLALMNGINGTMFSIAIALVAGLGGFILPSPIKK